MSYCVVRCWCCTTPCTTLYDASYIPDASGPDALYDTVRRVVRSRRVGPRRLVRRPDASYNAFPTALTIGAMIRLTCWLVESVIRQFLSSLLGCGDLRRSSHRRTVATPSDREGGGVPAALPRAGASVWAPQFWGPPPPWRGPVGQQH